MKTEIVRASNRQALGLAINVLEGGGLVAFPTDTVYGVAASPWSEEAVARLYTAKDRPLDRPIPLLLSDADQLDKVAVLAPRFKPLIEHFWPGGLTLVLPKREIVSERVSPGPTVAVRVPDLPLARDLIRGAGGALAVTSANLSGQLSPITAEEVEKQLGGRIDIILDGGPCRGGVPSSLLDCTTFPPTLLRHGAISEAALVEVVGPIKTYEEF